MNRRLVIWGVLAAVAVALVLFRPAPEPATLVAPGTPTEVEPAPVTHADSATAPHTAPAALSEPSPATPAHGITTLPALQRLIDRHGLDDPEVFHATAMAMDLCDDARLPKPITLQAMISRWQSQGDQQKAARVAALVARWCTDELRLDADQQWLAQMADPTAALYAAGGPLAETRTLLERARSAQAGGEHSHADAVIRDAIGNASGMFEWLELFALVNESSNTAVLHQVLAGPGLPRYLNQDAVQAGAMLAGCQLFGGCGPGSLLATMNCINTRCPHPMGLEEHTRYLLSAPARDDAEAIARALLALRHNPG